MLTANFKAFIIRVMTTSLRLALTFSLIVALLAGLTATASAASVKKPPRANSKAVMKAFAAGRVSIREAVAPQADARLFIAEYDRKSNRPQTFPATPITGIAGLFAGKYAILSFYASGQHVFSRGGEVPANASPFTDSSNQFANWTWVDPSGSALNEKQRAIATAQYNRAIARIRPLRLGGSFRATAYGPPWGGIEGGSAPGACSPSAVGINLCQGKQLLVVAANPKSFPYGSQLKIVPNPFNNPNLIFTVADAGAALSGNHLDFFVASGRAEQNAFARKRVRVWYLGRIPFDLGVPISEADLLPGPANELS